MFIIHFLDCENRLIESINQKVNKFHRKTCWSWRRWLSSFVYMRKTDQIDERCLFIWTSWNVENYQINYITVIENLFHRKLMVAGNSLACSLRLCFASFSHYPSISSSTCLEIWRQVTFSCCVLVFQTFSLRVNRLNKIVTAKITVLVYF